MGSRQVSHYVWGLVLCCLAATPGEGLVLFMSLFITIFVNY